MSFSPFERRRRAIARTALYGSLAAVLSSALATHHLLQRPVELGVEVAWAEVDWAASPWVRLLQGYLRIDSSTEIGDEYAAALYLASPLRAAGIPVTVERLGERKANLWAILEGEERDALVLHGHLDTDRILDPELWVLPPFAGLIDEPWIYGRGAFDMKSYTIAQLVAFLELAATHPRPRRSVIFLQTGSEESGSDLGIRWILREHPELADRFWGVITEGGVVEVISLGEPPKYWGTEFAQKRFVEMVACSSSRQRLVDLRRDLWDFGLGVEGLTVPPDVERFWELYAPSRDRSRIRESLADPHALARDPVAFSALPQYLQSMLRSEIVPFAVTESADGSFEMRIVVHLLPGHDLDAVLAEQLPEWMTNGATVTMRDRPSADAGSPLDHPLYEAIVAQVADDFDERTTGPFFLPWTATDARYLRHAGIPTYGFSPFFIMTPDTLNIGLANEKIALPGFQIGVELYTRLVERIAG